MSRDCLSDAEILGQALGGLPVSTHVAACATCRARIVALRGILGGIEVTASGTASASGGCLDEFDLAAIVDGDIDENRHAAAVAHLSSCGHCRERLASLAALLADAAIAAEVRGLGPPAHHAVRRWLIGAGMVAVATLVVLVGRPRGPPLPVSDHRGPTLTASAVPTPISPIGDVASGARLEWTRVPGADRYRVTLFNASGAVLFQGQSTDTVVTLPDSIVIAPGQSYLWKVEVRSEWDRSATSELIEFRVKPAPGSDAPTDSASRLARPTNSLRVRAPGMSDSALTLAARARPLELRDALAGTLALAVHGPTASHPAELETARRLAAAYATAWHDDFLARVVARFVAWPPERRAAKVWADSMRRVGITTFNSGATAAIAVWRRALTRAQSIDDTAGMAATLGNIGAAFSRNRQYDSAAAFVERSQRLAVAIGDLRTQANAASELAGISEGRNDPSEARRRYAEAVTLHERIGDSRGLASDYNNLAGLAQSVGDYAEARRQLEAALAINRRDGHPEFAATNLVNLATLASLTGDFAQAESWYREALGTWRVRKQWADVADALHDLGKLATRRGDYPAARVNLLEALQWYDRTDMVADAIQVRQELASTKAASGDLQGALDDLRQVQHVADSVQIGAAVRSSILLARADLAVQLNTRPEAERLYAAAELLSHRSGDRAGEAEAQQGHGALLLDQGNFVRAQELLDAALRTETVAGSTRAASLTRVQLGDLALQRGDTAGARRLFARAATDLDRLGDPVAAAAALGERAALEAAARLPAAADSIFRAALTKVGDHVAPEVTWRLHAGLAAVRRDQGAFDDAAREWRDAIGDIERSSGSLALPERRSGFLNDKWDAYVQLALMEPTRGRSAAAFDVSERLRAGEMREVLAQGRVAAPADTASELVAREQDLRRRIAELSRGLESASGGVQQLRGPDVTATGAVTREALLRAQESYADLLVEMRERAPRHAALVAPAPAGWHDVAHRLASDEAFIEYLVSDAASLAFVVTRDTMVAIRLSAGRHDLAPLIDFTRGTMQPRGTPRLDSLWRTPLRQLYRDLIGPIAASGMLAGKTRLTVVPHAELHYVPFAALISDEPTGHFLVERYDINVTPSASVWLALAARPRTRATEGVVAFAPRPDVLPGSRQEVAAIARVGGAGTRVFTGAAATEAAFRREAPAYRVIHLATYGVLNKQNPLFSFVELAGGGNEDGRLEAHEVFGLRLNADLVVLSACQTALASGALSDVPPGDDWVGLARAFLSAGAARVMATLWPVQDRATATLMERFYDRFRLGGDPARALAAAQRALIAEPATASPYYWAGFEVVGGR